MDFPNFYGKKLENASNFLDDLEMAFLVSGRDEEEVKLRAFPLVLREEAKTWFLALDPRKKINWDTLREAFMNRFGGSSNPEELWRKISQLQQSALGSYVAYEAQFLKLWEEWEVSLGEGERAPNFLQKERFLAGLFPLLQEKVKGKFPESFKEAMQWARLKDRKLQFQSYTTRTEQPQPSNVVTMNEQPSAPIATPEDSHLELLQRVTTQLDNLSINLVQGPRMQPQPRNEERAQEPPPPRRPLRRAEYFCYNCGEDGHGMYFCPHPRRFPGNGQGRGPRRQVTPPRERPKHPHSHSHPRLPSPKS